MTDATIEFRLGELAGQMKRLADEMAALRQEARAFNETATRRLEQHDQRDDDRFESVGVRLGTLEAAQGIQETERKIERRSTDRSHQRRNAIEAALIGLAAAIVSVLVLVTLTKLWR